jgi:hypothetical protein
LSSFVEGSKSTSFMMLPVALASSRYHVFNWCSSTGQLSRIRLGFCPHNFFLSSLRSCETCFAAG